MVDGLAHGVQVDRITGCPPDLGDDDAMMRLWTEVDGVQPGAAAAG